MPTYQCRLLNENEDVVRIEALGSGNDFDARREAMNLMMKTGRFRGYELWHQGLKVETYRPVSSSAID